jgi:hypothetical protein
MGVVLRCSHCDYEWTTKGDHIPAKCPSCQARIHGTENFETLGESFQSSHKQTDMSWGWFIVCIIGLIIFAIVSWYLSTLPK